MPIREYLTGRERLIYDEGYDDGFNDAKGTTRRRQLASQKYEPRTKKGPYTRRAYAKNLAIAKRRPSAYAKAYGVAYKQLKKKHPRASFGSLSKKAHAATRKKRGMKKGKK